jgi:imidazolonepropionase
VLATTRLAGARRDGTTVEVKSGYGLTLADELRLLAVAARATDDVTFLAGATWCRPSTRAAPTRWTHLCDDMVPRAPHARWVDVFCERAPSTSTSPGPC